MICNDYVEGAIVGATLCARKTPLQNCYVFTVTKVSLKTAIIVKQISKELSRTIHIIPVVSGGAPGAVFNIRDCVSHDCVAFSHDCAGASQLVSILSSCVSRADAALEKTTTSVESRGRRRIHVN